MSPVPPARGATDADRTEYWRRLRAAGKAEVEVEAEYRRLALDFYRAHIKSWQQHVNRAARAAKVLATKLEAEPGFYPDYYLWDGYATFDPEDDVNIYIESLRAKLARAVEGTERLALFVDYAIRELTTLAGVTGQRGRPRIDDPDHLRALVEVFGHSPSEAESFVNTVTRANRAKGSLRRTNRGRKAKARGRK